MSQDIACAKSFFLMVCWQRLQRLANSSQGALAKAKGTFLNVGKQKQISLARVERRQHFLHFGQHAKDKAEEIDLRVLPLTDTPYVTPV